MALQIVNNLDRFSPVYNPMYIYLDSTNKDKDGFKYIVDLYRVTAGGFETKIIRRRINPRALDGLCEINVNRILSEFVTYDEPLTQGSKIPINSFIRYKVKAYEEFAINWDFSSVSDGGNGTTVLNSTVAPTGIVTGTVIRVIMNFSTPGITALSNNLVATVSGTTIIINVPFSDFNDYITTNGQSSGSVSLAFSLNTVIDPETEVTIQEERGTDDGVITLPYTAFNGAVPNSFFTNRAGVTDFPTLNYYRSERFRLRTTTEGQTRPQAVSTMPFSFRVREGQRMRLNWFNDYRAEQEYLYMTRFGADGITPLEVRRISSATILFPMIANSVGSDIALNSAFVSGTDSGANGVNFFNQAQFYNFYRANTLGQITSQVYFMEIDRTPTCYEEYEIIFLDRLGSIGSFMTVNKSISTINLTKEESGNLYGNLLTPRAGSAYYATDELSSSTTPFNMNQTENIKLSIDWLTDSESNYFQELISSPFVAIKKVGDVYFRAVTVKNSSFERKRILNNENNSYELDLDIKNNEIINW